MAGNTYVNNTGRQEVISAVQLLDWQQIAVAGTYAAWDLPAGSTILRGEIKVLEAFDATRTVTVALDGDTLLSAIDLATVATTAVTVPVKQNSGPVQATVVTSGAMTQGKALITLEYVVENRSAFSQG